MGLFKKKEGKKEKKKDTKLKESSDAPELPPLPDSFKPEMPHFESPQEKNELPTFPSSKTGDRISNEAAKHAIKDEKIVPSENTKVRTKEIGDGFPNLPEEMETKNQPTMSQKSTQKQEPVFIRIDKYQESLKEFEKAKRKVLEVERDLKDVKELKKKEEKELENWEKEIGKIKSNLNNIDKVIFQQLEE